jgi:hypothetical protein
LSHPLSQSSANNYSNAKTHTHSFVKIEYTYVEIPCLNEVLGSFAEGVFEETDVLDLHHKLDVAHLRPAESHLAQLLDNELSVSDLEQLLQLGVQLSQRLGLSEYSLHVNLFQHY